MSFHTTDCYGISEISPTLVRMRAILNAVLDEADEADYPDAWLTHGESGWTLTYTSDRVMTLENADRDDMPRRYLRKVSPTQALELWQQLADGNTKLILGKPWERFE